MWRRWWLGTWLVALRYHARSRSGTHASTWPVSLRPCLNAATRGAIPAADLRLDHRRRRLLRARRERPRRRAAEQRDERAALHSITSSARASSVGGTSRPSALAVLRLITSSYFVGACTGRSAAFRCAIAVPRRRDRRRLRHRGCRS